MVERDKLQTMVRGMAKLLSRWFRRPNIEVGIIQWLDTSQGDNYLRDAFATIEAQLCLQEMLPGVGGSVLESDFRREAPQLFPKIARRYDPDATEEDIDKGLKKIEPSLEAAINLGWIRRDGEYLSFSPRATLIVEGTKVIERLVNED